MAKGEPNRNDMQRFCDTARQSVAFAQQTGLNRAAARRIRTPRETPGLSPRPGPGRPSDARRPRPRRRGRGVGVSRVPAPFPRPRTPAGLAGAVEAACGVCTRPMVARFEPYGVPPRTGRCPHYGAKPRSRALHRLVRERIGPRAFAGSSAKAEPRASPRHGMRFHGAAPVIPGSRALRASALGSTSVGAGLCARSGVSPPPPRFGPRCGRRPP